MDRKPRADGPYIGRPMPRFEDLRLVRGAGRYSDDIAVPRQAYAVFVRSPHAHANLRRIDTAVARAMPGVLAVLNGADYIADGLKGAAQRPNPAGAIDIRERAFASEKRPVLDERQYPIVPERVRYPGEAVAVVVAETLLAARDAAEAVAVDYEVLPAATDVREAHTAPTLWPSAPDNVALDQDFGDAAAVAAAFAAADLVVEQTFVNQRIVNCQMEPRSGIGSYDAESESYTLISGNQGVHAPRMVLAESFGLPDARVRFVCPDVGNRRLLATLGKLRNLGNTVLVVEHDEETIRVADYLVDLGPGAGEHGGHVIFQGLPQQLLSAPGESLTGQYLCGLRTIPMPASRRSPGRGQIVVRGARANNLKNVDVSFPLGTFIAVTGVSGSGKSTLVNEILYRSLARLLYRATDEPGAHAAIEGIDLVDKVIQIDQSPIGRTPRSNPATYTGLFTFIRELFAMLPESRARGYKAGRFSFNVKGGRCETCQGDGVIAIEMHFLPDVYVTCEECKGRRYNRETLEITYRGKSIAEMLELTVEQALPLVENFPQIASKLRTLQDVGLGYIKLGQSATTLSGGEAQRVKLSRELARRGTGRTLYILDEPTTGLHFEDVQRLLDVLAKLVDQGNTIVVIEHNLDVIKSADWVIDLGPEGGAQGGRVVAAGTPEAVAKAAGSATGVFLHQVLSRDPDAKLAAG